MKIRVKFEYELEFESTTANDLETAEELWMDDDPWAKLWDEIDMNLKSQFNREDLDSRLLEVYNDKDELIHHEEMT